jgi:hypothetical protein
MNHRLITSLHGRVSRILKWIGLERRTNVFPTVFKGITYE